MKKAWDVMMVVGSVAVGAATALAAEQAGSSIQQQPAATVSSATAQSILAVDGSIAMVDTTAGSPSLKVATADGNMVTVALDQAGTSIWKDGQESKFDPAGSQLRTGQRVKIRYALQGGKKVAKSVQIVQAAAASPSSAPSKSY